MHLDASRAKLERMLRDAIRIVATAAANIFEVLELCTASCAVGNDGAEARYRIRGGGSPRKPRLLKSMTRAGLIFVFTV